MKVDASSFRRLLVCVSLVLLSGYSAVMADSFDDDDNPEREINPTAVILFMFFGLCLGILTLQVISRLGEAVPYTVVIFLIGVLTSFLFKVHSNDAFEQSINDWVKINPDIMLFVFLPPLIFGEAMNLKWFHVQGAFNQALVLAGPGVLM